MTNLPSSIQSTRSVYAIVLLCCALFSARLSADPLSVYFSPNGGCTQAIVEEVGKAKKTVLVQAYSFTSDTIAQALVAAKKRGVDVEAILDKTDRGSAVDIMVDAGIPTYMDPMHAIAHNKVIVIDGQTVLTGSFNFTPSAENRNAENLLVVRDQPIAAKYAANWQTHFKHSHPRRGSTTVPVEESDAVATNAAPAHAADKNKTSPPSSETRKFVTLIESVTIKIPFGETVIAAGTRLPVVSRDQEQVRVRYLDAEYSIPAASTDLE
jgi:phosphatidylserine/phosphatidylglycerophosphate/cardiolipin synthase-like enzyme